MYTSYRYMTRLALVGLLLQPAMYAYDKKHLELVFDSHLQSFPVIEKDTDELVDTPEQMSGMMERVWNYISPKASIKSFDLNGKEKREITFKCAEINRNKKEEIVDATLLTKLKVVHGGERPEDHLIKRITKSEDSENDFAQTEFGKKTIIEMIAQPTSNLNTLRARQAIIQELVENPRLLKECEQLLEVIKNNETSLLEFQNPEDPMNDELFKKLYFSWFKSLNKNSSALEFRTRMGNFNDAAPLTVPAATVAGYVSGLYYAISKEFPDELSYAMKKYFKLSGSAQEAGLKEALRMINMTFPGFVSNSGVSNLKDFVHSQKPFLTSNHPISYAKAIWLSFPQVWNIAKLAPTGVKKVFKVGTQIPSVVGKSVYFGSLLSSFAGYGLWCNRSYHMAKMKDMIAKYIHNKMIGVANVVNTSRELYNLVQNNRVFRKEAGLLSLNPLHNRTNAPEFSDLIRTLNTSTFKGDASFFSLTGRVLASYEVMKEVKDAFAPMLNAVGQLDAYVAMARLYKTSRKCRVSYCFVEFVEQRTPYLMAQGFWNPFVSTKDVVVNDAEFGGDSPRNMILTGPNTGGKSTTIEGLLISVLLAQSFGIAPAKKLVLTPFAKLTGYMNVTDDIAVGASRFKAEVLASKKQLQAALSISPNEFSFNIRDEGIVGTDHKVGQEAEYTYTKKLGDIPNSINLMSTHYPKLVDLEQDTNGQFKNYRMDITRNDDGSIQRHFTLVEGPNTINIAMDILHEEGVL